MSGLAQSAENYDVFVPTAADNSKEYVEPSPEEWDLDQPYTKEDDISINAITPVTAEQDPNNTASTSDPISLTSGRRGKISSTSDVDWYRFTPTKTGMYRLDLLNIPYGKDYDLHLYDSAQAYIASSVLLNGYESIVANLTTNNVYYIRVHGYNEAYSTTDEYKLTVTDNRYATLGWKYFFRWDASYYVGGYYYYGHHPDHKGIDVIIPYDPSNGEPMDYVPVFSPVGGTVKYAGAYGRAGNMVAIETGSTDPDGTGNKLWIRNLHLRDGSIPSEITSGLPIDAQELIGYVGNTGDSDVAHLHFDINAAVTYNGNSLTFSNTRDPEPFFSCVEFTHNGLTPLNNDILKRHICEAPMVIDLEKFFDNSLIHHVGVGNFYEWFNSTPFEEQSLTTYQEQFNISDTEFMSLLQNNSVTVYDQILSIN